MATFLTSVKLAFVDNFSKGYGAALAKLEGINESGSKIQKTGKKTALSGALITAGLTTPLVGVAAAALNAGVSIDRSMANIQSLGLTQARVAELKTGIQDVALDVRKRTGDMTDGLYNVVSAFGDSSDSLALLKINAKAGAAGLATTTDAINLTSAVMKGYGEVSVRANQKAADLALKTVQLGQTTFPELAASIGKITPVAAEMNVTQEELFTTMATLTGVTGGAAEVTTQARGAIQAFMAPTAQMTGLLSSLGFSTGKTMIKQLGFQGALLEVVKAAEASGQPLQNYIGSIEGQTAALALAGGQADVYPEKLAAMSEYIGTTDAAFKAQTEGINANGAALDLMKVKLEVASQRLAAGLAPAITATVQAALPFIDKLGAMATRFAEMDPAQQKMIIGTFGVLAAIGPTTAAVGGMMTTVGGLMKASSKVGPIFGGIKAALFGTTTAAGTATPGLFGLAAANWAVIWPVLALTAAIAAAIAIGIILYKNWDTITEKAGILWGNVKSVFGSGIDWIGVKLNQGAELVNSVLDNKFVQGSLIVLAPFIGIPVAVAKNWGILSSFFSDLWKGIKASFSDGVGWVTEKAAKIPLLGKMFNGDESGKATVTTFARGMYDAMPAVEQSAYAAAAGMDAYFPHSDARKGPLSKLTSSGASLITTFTAGAEGQSAELDNLLAPAGDGSFGRVVNFNGASSENGKGGTVINIENLTIQAEEIRTAMDFVEMLRMAGGF